MYGNYNPNFMIEKLTRQKEEIDNLLRNYQNGGQQTPVNNIINTSQVQTPTKDFVEWRVLNENEEVDNLYVNNKTFFINDNTAILKGVDGSIIKWQVKQVYPIDKKDEKINQLEEEIRKLKEVINEHTKSDSTVRERNESDGDANEHVESKSKTTTKSVSK